MVSVDTRWSGVDKLFVYQKQKGCPLRELRWNLDMNNSITRKLVNESHSIFIDFQETCEEETVDQKTFLATSHQYRAVVQSCVMKLKDKLRYEKREEVTEKIKDQLDLYSYLEMIWHLCEVLLIESKSGGYCLPQLLTWLKWHFNDIDQLAQSVVSSVEPHSHPEFWTVVYGLVSQGRLSEVVDLLSQYPCKEHGCYNAMASIKELLTKMPSFGQHQGSSVNDFESKWQYWQNECSARLNDSDFSEYPELEVICQLLTGDESELLKRELSATWYELMVYKLLYCNPTIKASNLKKTAIECMEMVNGIGNISGLDEILLSIVSLDVHNVIEKCSENLENWWFVVHLGDLLYHCDLLKTYDLNYGEDLRNFLLLEYGASLMSHPSLWSIGGDYFMCSPNIGRGHLEKYIEKIPLDNERKALKLINLCDKYNLVEQKHGICKSMGMQSLRRRRLGVALSWCLRAKDEVFASILTDHYLNHYIQTGTFMQCELIENLGSAMLLNNKLTFLGKYYEFHKLYVAKEFPAAASLLVSLLTSSLAPKKFWMILLIDALPLLQHEEVIFSYEQTLELMQCLVELKLCNSGDEVNKSKGNSENEKDQIGLLNLALCRNMSRASLIQPESIMPIR